MKSSDINKSTEILKTLSRLVDDEINSEGTDKSFAYFNEAGNIIDNDLVPVIEKLQYENKYAVIEKLKDILMDMALYLYFPEIINTTVVGIYGPYEYKNDFKKLCKKVLDERFKPGTIDKVINLLLKNENNHIISNIVPTILFNSQEQLPIKILNLPEKLIDCVNKEYIDFLKYSDENDLALESFSYAISMSSSVIPKALSYIIIPKGIDTDSKYFSPVTNSLDMLIIKGEQCSKDALELFPNLSEIIVIGTVDTETELYCKEKNIKICSEYADLNSAFVNINKSYHDLCGKDNFCYKYYFENVLLEISQYLAERNYDIENRITEINENLVYISDDIRSEVDRFKTQYNYDVDSINKIYSDYTNVCRILLEKIADIHSEARALCQKESSGYHIAQEELIMELIIRLAYIYKIYPQNDSNKRLTELASEYKNISGKTLAANLIINDFMSKRSSGEEINEFTKLNYSSEIYIRKLLELYEYNKIRMDINTCGEMILKLKSSLNVSEYKLLGKYYLHNKDYNKAKKILMKASLAGDKTASEMIMQESRKGNTMKLENDDITALADSGSAEAAYKKGMDYYKKINDSTDENYTNCIKYLNIAAAQDHMAAIAQLADIYYNEGFTTDSPKEKERFLQSALRYYSSIKNKNGEIYEKTGNIFYELEQYSNAAKEYEKSKTAESNYKLGIIYENGLGHAADNKQALAYYEAAIDKGHSEAQTAYEKLNAKIEKEKEKTVIEDNKSYSSYTYYSYYSYYSGGW